MAKGTSSSKCPVEDRGSKIGSTVRLDSFKTNSGFFFKYSVDLTGVKLSDDEVRKLGRCVFSFLDRNLESICNSKISDSDQMFLF